MFPYSDSQPFWDCGKKCGGRPVVPAAPGNAHCPPRPLQAMLCPHLHDLQLLLGGFDELGDGHVDELVLRLRLHHARALGPYHLDRLLDVDVTVQAWQGGRLDVRPWAEVVDPGAAPPSAPPRPQAPSPLVETLSMSMSMTMMVPVRPMPALRREGAPSEAQPALAGSGGKAGGPGAGVGTAPAGAGLREPGRVTAKVGRVEVCPTLHPCSSLQPRDLGAEAGSQVLRRCSPDTHHFPSQHHTPPPASTPHSAPHPRRSGTPGPDHILPAPLVLWASPALSHSLGPSAAALLASGASFGKAPFPFFFRS